MDFIVFSALLNTILFDLILSYDIACQYGKNFWSRMEALPQYMHLSMDRARVWFKVPNFHLPLHQPVCHSAYSFHYMWGAGRTHGETVEQNWEFINGAAASTKMMALGSWFGTLEDLFAFHNWRRQVSWRNILARRMAENVKEGRFIKMRSRLLMWHYEKMLRSWLRARKSGCTSGRRASTLTGQNRRSS